MDALTLLDELNRADEHARLEAKTSREFGASLLETICAFANEPGLGGGDLLLGVERTSDGRYVPVGIEDPDRVSQEIASACASTFNVPVRPSIRTDVVDGKVLLTLHVPESSPSEKPVYFIKQGLPKGAYRRVGSTDQRLTEDDLAAFYDHRRGHWFDRTPVETARLDDFDTAAIAEYRRLRGALQPGASELRWTDEELLEALGALVREGDRLLPTLTGIVVFGRPAALRRLFPMLRVDYVRVYGTEWAPGPDGRFETRELRGPALLLVQEIQQIVLEGMLKRVVVGDDQMARREIPQLPAEVIREAVVNAVMHRSYRRQDPLMVVRYSNRVEILNPGASLKHEEAFSAPGSVPRNPAIAMVFHESGLAETKGSGIRTMRDRMKAVGLSAPTFVSDRRDDRFTARFLFHHFLDEADLAWLARFSELGLTNEEMAALIFVREVKAIDNLSFRQLTGLDSATATLSLRRLRMAGLLEAHGRGAGTFYRPTSAVLAESMHANSPDATTNLRLPVNRQLALPLSLESSLTQDLGPLSHDPLALSQDPGSLSHDPLALSQDPSQRATLTQRGLTAEIQGLITSLGQRSKPERFREVVIQLCKLRAFRADELADLLKRDPTYIVRTYLTPLVEAGHLERTHPHMLHHPDQAYRSAPEEAVPDTPSP